MRRWSHVTEGAAIALALAVPGSAAAAYAPKLAIVVDPATPGTPPAITSTITQAGGENPSRTVRLSFPAGFTAPSTPVSVGICSAQQESRRACAADSTIGAADATASVLGLPVALHGSVHYGGVVDNKIKLIVFLDNALLGQHQTVEGFVELRPADAGFDTVFDGLPNILTTRFALALDGAPRSLVVTPVKCGTYMFSAAFTSQTGAKASSTASVAIAGCKAAALVMSPLDLAPERPRADRGTTLSFQLSEPAHLVVKVKRGDRLVATYRKAGRAGHNALRLGHGLRPGRYGVRAAATTSDGRATARRATLVVVGSVRSSPTG